MTTDECRKRGEDEAARILAEHGPDLPAWHSAMAQADWEAEAYLRTLKAPFPWFGGKSRVAHIVWERFGNVPNYVEPFAGSLAVLLGRPHSPNTETVNDLDCYLANFWRALKHEPEELAAWADWPVNEADLLARHRWLIAQTGFRENMRADPDYYSVKMAGWWLWGICCWIGSGWCKTPAEQLPHLGDAGRGIHRKLPHLGDAGMGIHRKLPHLGNAGMGIHRKLPHLGNAGRANITGYLCDLADRLRRVRVCCGEWSRALSDAVTIHHGITAVFLDPPYLENGGRSEVYSTDSTDVANTVREWAIENGSNLQLRIALCGYDGEHEMPADWDCVKWKQRKGYQSVAEDGTHGGHRERIWFSPHCIKPPSLFD